MVEALREDLPTWKKAAKIMMAIASSLATADRLFFIDVSSLSSSAKQERRVLEDQSEVALIRHFDRRRRSFTQQSNHKVQLRFSFRQCINFNLFQATCCRLSFTYDRFQPQSATKLASELLQQALGNEV